MTKSELIHRIESYIPDYLLKSYRTIKRFHKWKSQKCVYDKCVMDLRKRNQKIKVLFILKDSAEWKYDSVYQLMEKDDAFEPIILICPLILYPNLEYATKLYAKSYASFLERGCNVIKASNEVTEKPISVGEINPDIVFYSSPWTQYIHPKYNEKSLKKYLKCHVNYGFSNTAGEWGYASAFHGLMWRYFAECEDIKTIALLAQEREMQNIVVTGYPIYDAYQSANNDASMWKSADPKFKRIIWAPHHSIEGHNGLLSFSTFLENAEKILEFAENNKDKYQFAFKPHPLLLQALYNHPKWGKEKADAYYKSWEEGENTTLQTGTYMELFKSSDAMIHDCGSFIIEYLYTQKPVMYLGNSREEQSNVVGKKAYACHYHGTTIEEIDVFLDDVVQNGNDDLKTTRKQFYDEVLLPPNGCSVAENIINEIKRSIYG